MANTLNISRDELRSEIGLYLGYGVNPDNWGESRTADVRGCLKRGLRRFYFPPGEDRHPWSFLRPSRQLTLVAGVDTYDLPEDFLEILDEGFAYASGVGEGRISRCSEWQLRSLQSEATRTGQPKYCAVRVRQQPAGADTRYEVVFYPTPESAATLSYRAAIAPPELTDENPYPIAGPGHAETILAACLAVAEESRNDGNDGTKAKIFEALLASSIAADKRVGLPSEDGVWPFENAAAGLQINKAYLRRLVGIEAGFGPHAATWSHKQRSMVESVVEAGLRKFYDPPLLRGSVYKHEWSFAAPFLPLNLTSGVDEYELPEGVASVSDHLVYAPGSNTIYPAISLTGASVIHSRRQRGPQSGLPTLAATSPVTPQGNTGTRYKILFWPTPDSDYLIRYQCQINFGMLSADTEIPHGGQAHAQTVIEACLAAHEESHGVVGGPHGQLFERCLQSSVAHDQQVSSPKTLGVLSDNSDFREVLPNIHSQDNLTTYNGVVY